MSDQKIYIADDLASNRSSYSKIMKVGGNELEVFGGSASTAEEVNIGSRIQNDENATITEKSVQ